MPDISIFEGWQRLAGEKRRGYADQILGKLLAENVAIDASWTEIESALHNTVVPEFCMRVAACIRFERRIVTGFEV